MKSLILKFCVLKLMKIIKIFVKLVKKYVHIHNYINLNNIQIPLFIFI